VSAQNAWPNLVILPNTGNAPSPEAAPCTDSYSGMGYENETKEVGRSGESLLHTHATVLNFKTPESSAQIALDTVLRGMRIHSSMKSQTRRF
jgi:hypothetical protein